MEIRSYRDLEVWKKSMDLVVECYGVTRGFPQFETFGLASQMQRAVVSVPSNIAEGRTSAHGKEFLRYLSIAGASLAELETHIEIAERLKYIDQGIAEQLLGRAVEIGRMLNGLRRSIRKRKSPLTPGT